MTPVDKYRVYFGRASSRDGLLIEETSDNLTTSLTIADITQGGNYTVGVAAVNSAGPSGITFVQGGIGRDGIITLCLATNYVKCDPGLYLHAECCISVVSFLPKGISINTRALCWIHKGF